jgi:hypothetical protein
LILADIARKADVVLPPSVHETAEHTIAAMSTRFKSASVDKLLLVGGDEASAAEDRSLPFHAAKHYCRRRCPKPTKVAAIRQVNPLVLYRTFPYMSFLS